MAKTIRAKNKCADTMEQRAKGIDGAPNPRSFLRGERQATGPRLSDSVSDSTASCALLPRAGHIEKVHGKIAMEQPKLAEVRSANSQEAVCTGHSTGLRLHRWQWQASASKTIIVMCWQCCPRVNNDVGLRAGPG